ncbi:unnamed protein product [Boreogadus saida]
MLNGNHTFLPRYPLSLARSYASSLETPEPSQAWVHQALASNDPYHWIPPSSETSAAACLTAVEAQGVWCPFEFPQTWLSVWVQ